MALLSAYATATEYRDAKGDFATGTDDTLTAQLLSMSRLLERKLRVAPGAFNSAASEVRTFDGHGEAVLWLRDRDGRGFFLQADEDFDIGVDTEGDGTFDGYTFDETTAWIRGLPENAGAESEPVYALEILSSRSGVTLTTWPNRPASIRITGTFGWAAVPQVIKDLVIHRTIELRDALKAGSSGELGTFDGGIPMRSNTTWLLKEAERLYGRKVPVF